MSDELGADRLPEPADDEAHEPPPPDETGWATPSRVALCWLACGLFGAVNAFHVLAAMVGRAVFVESKQIEQLVPGIGYDSLPVPVGAVGTWQWIETTRQIGRQPWMLAATVLLGLAAGALLVQVIHPRLTVYLRERYFRAYKLLLAGLLSLVCLVLAFWRLPDEVMETWYPWARAAVTGGLLLLLWHRKGWLHPDAVWPSYFMLGSRFAVGAGLGIAAAELLGHHPRNLDLWVLYGWQDYLVSPADAGLWCAEAWRVILLHTVLSRAWYGLLVGGLALSFGPTGLPLRRRVRTVALLAVIFVAGLVGVGQWRMTWRSKHDFAQDIALNIAQQTRPAEPDYARLIVPTGAARPPAAPAAPAMSVVGLPLTPEMDARVSQVLEPDRPVSAGAHKAWIHRHDRATYAWSVPAALAVQLGQLRSPTSSPPFAGILIETLMTCGDLPAARQAVDALLDPAQFAWPTADGTAVMATLAWRWGRLDQVRERVAERRPDLLERLGERPMQGLDGRVTGQLLLGGQPLTGVRVGLLPRGDARLLRAAQAVPPWAMRRVQAASLTDDQGRFTLTAVPEGVWRVVIALPRAQDPTRRGELVVEQDVAPVVVPGAGARVELAPIRLRVKPRPPSTRSA